MHETQSFYVSLGERLGRGDETLLFENGEDRVDLHAERVESGFRFRIGERRVEGVSDNRIGNRRVLIYRRVPMEGNEGRGALSEALAVIISPVDIFDCHFEYPLVVGDAAGPLGPDRLIAVEDIETQRQ